MITYADECVYIWKNHVPEQGQADTLQGELLRQIEKLRYEAQDNGNVNWDEDFEFFCTFLKYILCTAECIPQQMKKDVTAALAKIRKAGETAALFFGGKITMQELAITHGCTLAYMDDDLYDVVCDAIGLFYIGNREPIPYHKRDDIKR